MEMKSRQPDYPLPISLCLSSPSAGITVHSQEQSEYAEIKAKVYLPFLMRLLLETICIREGRPKASPITRCAWPILSRLYLPDLEPNLGLCPGTADAGLAANVASCIRLKASRRFPLPLTIPNLYGLYESHSPTDLNYEHKWLDRYALESLRQAVLRMKTS